jgi:ribosomal-protein-serine acetyltransferase
MTIHIRLSQPKDAISIFEMVEESIESTYPVQDWCHPAYTLEDAMGWIAHGQKCSSIGSEYHFVISDDHDCLLGTTSIIRVDRKNALAQTGYFVRESARGKGIAVAGCLLTVQFAFDQLHLQRFELLIATHNVNSVRVAEKIKAVCEGTLQDRLKWQDLYHDAYLYALLNQK